MENEATKLIHDLAAEELAWLKSLIDLADKTEIALRTAGQSNGAVTLMRNFKPFQIAREIIASGDDPKRHHVVVSKTSETESADGSIADVLFLDFRQGRVWRFFDLALDLLQYWELILRHHTKLECEEFCRGTRKTLCGRIKRTLANDAFTSLVFKFVPEFAVPKFVSPTTDAVEADILNRLNKIARHLDQKDSLQSGFQRFTKEDREPPMNNDLMELRHLYVDELSLILSEQVHLFDNVAKLLRARRQPEDDLSAVEALMPCRAAACYVNTLKHGVRGRNRSSAVGEHEILVSGKNDLSGEEQIVYADLLINFEGEAWQAMMVIDDLIQIWDLFLRNYTDVDTTAFRRKIGGHFAAREQLSTYTCKLPNSIESGYKQKLTERKCYTI